MSRRVIGVALNGVTGRMGYNQHLVRSILAIRDGGGLELPDGTHVWPEPLLVGRNAERLRTIAERHGLKRWTTSLDEALADPDIEVYFDAQLTSVRQSALRAAIAAGKHVYAEKPVAETLDDALSVARLADEAGVKGGVVQDKLFLPGLIKLRRLVEGGFFGRVLSLRGEFGYWVFEGDWQPAQRPSWNYRAEAGGGILLDMVPHWQYLVEGLLAPVRSVYAHATTHVPERFDERGERYAATADDAAYLVFELEGGVVAQINSSWTVRVHRDELVEFQVDGTAGSAVAGLWNCRVQPRAVTQRAVWNPDVPATDQYRAQWQTVPDNRVFDNAFKAQWDAFFAHVVSDAPFPHDLYAGARGVQVAELAVQSAREGRRVPVPELAR